jgi:hypothetical protein
VLKFEVFPIQQGVLQLLLSVDSDATDPTLPVQHAESPDAAAAV